MLSKLGAVALRSAWMTRCRDRVRAFVRPSDFQSGVHPSTALLRSPDVWSAGLASFHTRLQVSRLATDRTPPATPTLDRAYDGSLASSLA